MSLPEHWSKALIPGKKSSKQLRKSCSFILTATVLFSGVLSSVPAIAGAIVGATEFTQIANNIEMVMQYAQQVQQYETQLQQYQAQLKNMEQNPGGAMSGNATQIIQGVGSIMAAEKSMGGTLNRIDANFSQKYNNPIAGSYADKYKTWTDTSVNTLGSALRAAGLHRDAYASDAQALQALYNQSQSSSGTVAATQQLSALTTMQIQQSQRLGDLMSTQNIASSTWMASQSRKQEAAENRASAVAGSLIDVPTGTTSKSFTPLQLKLN